MTLHVHVLEGCAPTPLAHYLKALAVLRLVAEQRDPSARGWWKRQAFCLSTTLSREELIQFFLDDYAPTPILSPWNAGSGFYFREGKTKEKGTDGKLKKTGVRDAPTAATRATSELLATQTPRLANYRECVSSARAVVLTLKLTEAPEGESKAALIATLRSRLADAGLTWIDAAVTSIGDAFSCAPLVGSGGNDGNEDFSKNFLERVLWLVGPDGAASSALLQACLFGGPVPGASDVAAGQFFPAGNGGVNAGTGFTGSATANRWEYIFAMEGSTVFRGSVARRCDGLTGGAAFPFAVRLDPAGYASAADADRDASRAEVWLPLWSQPSQLSDVWSLLAEGRIRIDRGDAQRTTDVARAIGALGTSRGIKSFERTAFFTRNGNMHYSAPSGRWDVATQPHALLLDDVQAWLRNFRSFARDALAPKAITLAARVLDEALLAVCRSGNSPWHWQQFLMALGRAEGALLQGPRTAADPKRRLAPLPSLRQEWIDVANDGSPEFRLAVALASQDVSLRHQGGEAFANVRAHWMPIDRSRSARRPHAGRRPARFATNSGGLTLDPDVVCQSDQLERDCVALIRRRVQIASTFGARNLGVAGARGAEASLSDVMVFLEREVDDARILALARPLMAIDWTSPIRLHLEVPREPCGIDAAYAVARITHLSGPLDWGDRITIPLDSEPVARLAAGDLANAVEVCLRRLRASGLRPRVRVMAGNPSHARRVAACLAFPIRSIDASRCAESVTKPDNL